MVVMIGASVTQIEMADSGYWYLALVLDVALVET